MTILSTKLRRLLLSAAGKARALSPSSIRIASFFSSSRSDSSRSNSSRCDESDGFSDRDDGDGDAEIQEKYLADVPQGCFAVYVGRDRQRFVVGTCLLRDPLFRVLLDKAADEYGLDRQGALLIPCEAVLFDHICWLLGNNDPAAASLEMEELLDFYSS
ncbi:uncharacterized protein LOC112342243 [Selaginella moellendorffii]|uniref:uncharacterized protein LOC112342243 n=1 Tax=Selaginella moellendorffii TaxID=88036 RepID=UPI000D1CBD38|nr:uncharacterized protein LOC112342243 [Selaginella moellendorffii]|eukprot:XP_024519537.1 uncharacterized protein LOC112342243 [Selaginella moellendorffii]